jgi:hypothetical protein
MLSSTRPRTLKNTRALRVEKRGCFFGILAGAMFGGIVMVLTFDFMIETANKYSFCKFGETVRFAVKEADQHLLFR